jgi:hypothetical protein
MFKSGIAGRRVDEPRKAKLVNPAKSLHDGRIEDDKLPGLNPDCEPYGVVYDLEAARLPASPNGTGV